MVMNKLFASDREVPDLCPPDLLLPDNAKLHEFAPPRARGNISPVEMSWFIFDEQRASRIGAIHLHLALRPGLHLQTDDIKEMHREIGYCDFLNHNTRVMARIALDPRRYETFDFAEVYDLDRGKTFPKYGERVFFEEFHYEHGVVERPDPRVSQINLNVIPIEDDL